jgi:hypothetical protein
MSALWFSGDEWQGCQELEDAASLTPANPWRRFLINPVLAQAPARHQVPVLHLEFWGRLICFSVSANSVGRVLSMASIQLERLYGSANKGSTCTASSGRWSRPILHTCNKALPS